MKKVYIFNSEARARKLILTAQQLNIIARRIGSAVIMDSDEYETILKKTYAIPTAIIATEEGKAK